MLFGILTKKLDAIKFCAEVQDHEMTIVYRKPAENKIGMQRVRVRWVTSEYKIGSQFGCV